MPDVGVCIIEAPNEDTSSGVDSQVGLAGVLTTGTCDVCNKKGNGKSSKHFEQLGNDKD